jgi:NADH:ubiquinone oxidoreductase subunit 6 (subunit J)
MESVIFIVLSIVVLGCALVVVASRNVFHSAIFLAFSFVGVAGLYLLMQAEFLAGIQILVYVGAIVTLIVFAIMLSRDLMDPSARAVNRQWAAAAAAGLLTFIVLAVVVTRVQWPTQAAGVPSATMIADLGQAMVEGYMIPFEVMSVLLLVALVGSIIIARER